MYDTFWNYLKKSFNLIFQNTILFVPTLIEFLISIAFIVGGVVYVGVFGAIDFPNIGSILYIVLGVIAMIILQLFISAGKYNMIKQAVTAKETNMTDFWTGAKKYAGRIFLGGLIVIGVVLMALLIIVVPAIFSKSAGLVIFCMILFIIPAIVLGIFVSFWETILVYEDCDVMNAFKLSFSFAKKHFGLVFVINLLQGILTREKNSNSDGSDKGSINLPFTDHRGDSPLNVGRHFFGINPSFPFGGLALIIMVIKTFLTLYFEVIFFVIYHDRRDSISYDINGFDE